jgi:hypothetical protein
VTEDAEVETAAAVIEDLLFMVAPDKRAAVLARATEVEKEESAERQKHGGLRWWSGAEMACMDCPGIRYWHDIMKFKADVVYTFTRNITNNHSPENAAKLLFSRKLGRPGSGYLEQYLDGVMPLAETTE